MNYELLSFVIVSSLVFLLMVTRRWLSWPFSLRSLYWCGAFSYIVLLALPRVFIWPSSNTLIQIVFWVLGATLFAWILASHDI